MLHCLGKNIFQLQSVPLFAGLFQELECLVYGMGPILLKCTQDVVVQGLVMIFFIPRQTTVKTTREECQIFIQHIFKIVLYWFLDLIRHNVGTPLKHNKYIFDIPIPFHHNHLPICNF